MLYISGWLLTLIIVVIVVFLVLVAFWGVRAHRKKIAAGREDLVGKTAVVEARRSS